MVIIAVIHPRRGGLMEHRRSRGALCGGGGEGGEMWCWVRDEGRCCWGLLFCLFRHRPRSCLSLECSVSGVCVCSETWVVSDVLKPKQTACTQTMRLYYFSSFQEIEQNRMRIKQDSIRLRKEGRKNNRRDRGTKKVEE